MEVRYSRQAKADIEYWKTSGNKNIQQKISELIDDIKVNPFEGLGNQNHYDTICSVFGQGELIINTDLFTD